MTPDDATGQRIRELRSLRERSQAELAEMAGPGLSATYLSMIESGKRPASQAVLGRLARLLDTTPEYLATGTQPAAFQEAERRVAFAEMALHNGSAAAALGEFDEILAIAPAPLVDRARLGRAKALEALSLLPEAAAEYEMLGRAAEVGGAQWAERHMDLARCYIQAGEVHAAIDVGERALATFESLGLEWTDETVRLGVTLAGAYWGRGEFLYPAGLLRRLLRAADAMDSPLARGSVLWNTAIVAAENGRPRDAAMLAQRALALLGEAGHQRNLAKLRAVYGQLLAEAEPDQAAVAMELQQKALAALIEVDNQHSIAWAESHLSVTALRLGEIDLARSYARSAADRIQGLDPEEEAAAHVALAEAEHAAGNAAAAASAADVATEHLRQVPWAPRERARLWHRIAALREQLGDLPGSVDAYRQAMLAAGFPEPQRPSALVRPPTATH